MELNNVSFLALLFRATAGTDKVLILEHPASQGEGSPFAAAGRERHSTLSDTTIIDKVRKELGLDIIYTEQGASGAKTRKPTALLCTKSAALPLRRTVGALYLAPGVVNTGQTVGTDDDGNFVTHGQEIYTPQFALRLSVFGWPKRVQVRRFFWLSFEKFFEIMELLNSVSIFSAIKICFLLLAYIFSNIFFNVVFPNT